MPNDLSSGTSLQNWFNVCKALVPAAFDHQVFIGAKSQSVDICYPWDGFENGRWRTRPALVYPSGGLYMVGRYMNTSVFTPQLYRAVYAERRTETAGPTYHQVTSVRSKSDYERLLEALRRLETMPVAA